MHVLGIFAVWLVWTLVDHYVEFPRPWAFGLWGIFAIVLGIGWELLVEPSTWWLGFGTGGAAVVLARLIDLLTVLTDRVKMAVLGLKGRV